MICTFFGHKDTPKEIEPTLRSTLIDLIANKNVNVFYVGNNGNFDTMVRRQLEELSQTYPISYSVVLAYLPMSKNKCDITAIRASKRVRLRPRSVTLSALKLQSACGVTDTKSLLPLI